MKLTHDAQAALERLGEAALEMNEYTTPGTMAWSCFAEAAKAYRATQAKECRPPDGAKDGSRWYLTRTVIAGDADSWTVGTWHCNPSDGDNAWDLLGANCCGPRYVHSLGWTVDSECRFGETGVEATVDEVDALIDGVLADDALCGRNGINRAGLRVLVSKSTHFRASKLEISDEEIDAIHKKFTFHQFREAVRAVIAKVSAPTNGKG